MKPARAKPPRSEWEFQPLAPGRWDDLEQLFGPRGACAGCWCMFPRNTTSEGATSGAPDKRAFRKLVAAGPPPGLLAYENNVPVGWVAIAPRAEGSPPWLS